LLRAGRPTKGITKQALVKRLREWGVNPSADQVDALWEKYGGTTGGGKPQKRINYRVFMDRIHHKDYTCEKANMFRGFSEPADTTFNDIMLASVGQRKLVRQTEDEIFTRLRNTAGQASPLKMELQAVEDLVRTKIMNQTRADSVEKREAYKVQPILQCNTAVQYCSAVLQEGRAVCEARREARRQRALCCTALHCTVLRCTALRSSANQLALRPTQNRSSTVPRTASPRRPSAASSTSGTSSWATRRWTRCSTSTTPTTMA
jgi:hypothetical protein